MDGLSQAAKGNTEAEKQAYDRFLRAYPAYASTLFLDELRAKEYSRLDAEQHVYLDYNGASLYADFQLYEHSELLLHSVFGNPHSQNLTSLAMTRLVDQARASVLKYFNASPAEYDVVFTQNATGALKLVGEAYPFSSAGKLLLTSDNHNSVNGIREFARSKGTPITYLPLLPDLRVDEDEFTAALELANHRGHNLFAYPAQSNFSGVQHPLEWIEEAHARGWDVLLDAAAFVPTNHLDLGRWNPDFVDISFYKMFGYPTGVGCLLARKEALRKLNRPWYAGGTITFSSVQGDGHYLTPGSAGFEDGTVNFLSLPAVEIGLDYLASIGVDAVHTRVMCLTGWLLEQLLALRYRNGQRLLTFYGPTDCTMRGATIGVNFLRPDATLIDCLEIEHLANKQRISLRAGCHCNPGARERAFGMSADDLSVCFRDADGMPYDQFLRVIEGKTTGAVRASLGLVSTFGDVYRFLRFAESFLESPVAAGTTSGLRA